MTANTYFGTSSDYVFASYQFNAQTNLLALAPGTLKAYDAETGGTQLDITIGGTTSSSISVGPDGAVPAAVIDSPNTDASVWVSLNDGPRVRVVPQGLKGAKGDQGDTGSQGPKGDAGPQGPKGDQGLPGVNAIPADDFVAGIVPASSGSATSAALNSAIAQQVEDALDTSKPEDYAENGHAWGTDDSAAVLAAVTAAGVGGLVEFRRGRTYVINRQVVPLARQTWFGFGATIKRANQITTTTATAITTGTNPTTLTVASTAGLKVGMTVTVTTGPNNKDGCYVAHPITAIGSGTITVSGNFTKAFPSGGTVVTHHGLIASPTALGGDASVGVKGGDGGTADYADDIHIIGLTVDGNRGNNTAYTAWQTNASIGLYSDNGSVENCRIIDSQSDGIIAGGQGMMVAHNIILRSGGNSIHLSGLGGGKIVNNYCKDATLAITGTDNTSGPDHAEGLMTWSSYIVDTIVSGNYFENGRTIFGGMAGADNRANIIANNICLGATLYAVEAITSDATATSPRFGSLLLTGNKFSGCGPLVFQNTQNNAATQAFGTPVDRIILTGNEFYNTKVQLFRCKAVAISGNNFLWDAALSTTILLYFEQCSSLAINGNSFVGGTYGIYAQGRAPVSGATKWLVGLGIEISGNTMHNQADTGISIPAVTGFAWRTFSICNNTITSDTTQTTAAIQAANGVLVQGNTIDTQGGRGINCAGDSSTAPAGIPGTTVLGNFIRTTGDSVRISSNNINNIVQRNYTVTAVNNQQATGNTVDSNVLLAA